MSGGRGRYPERLATETAARRRTDAPQLRESDASEPLAAEDWETFLSAHLSRRVRVDYGRSRTNPLLARRPRRSAASRTRGGDADWHVRMHAMFASAPPRIRSAVAELLRPGSGSRRARTVLEGWIDEMLASLPPRVVEDSKLVTRGSCHDLAAIAADLLAREMRADFGPKRTAPRITWGRSGARRSRRGMRLGSYDAELHLVRMHPALDQPTVPTWFVRYVLFHELLHAVHPPVKGEAGRWIRHGAEFRRREKAYPELKRALDWERAHIDALVRSARKREPLRLRRRAGASPIRALQRLLFPD